MKNVNININPATLAGGAFMEKLNDAIAQVVSNIQNQQADPTEKREVTIKLVFRADQDRRVVTSTIGMAVKLAPTESVSTAFIMDHDDYDEEELTVREFDARQVIGQMSLEA